MSRKSPFLACVGLFLIGVATGATITIAVDLNHDEAVRKEVWHDAIAHGVTCEHCSEKAKMYALAEANQMR